MLGLLLPPLPGMADLLGGAAGACGAARPWTPSAGAEVAERFAVSLGCALAATRWPRRPTSSAGATSRRGACLM